MSVEQNKTILKQAIEEFNKPNLDSYLNIYDENVVLYGYPPGLPAGKTGAKIYYSTFFEAFKDHHLTLDEVVAENDKIACSFTLKAVHKNAFMGIPATNKEITIKGMTILRFVDGKCVERWQAADDISLMKQLGVIPE
jgi:predicted ester cyclase